MSSEVSARGFYGRVDKELRDVCLEISKRYEIIFLEIGTDMDHVHFLVQAIPMYSPKKIVQTIKSITAQEIFRRVPSVKKALWGGEFWLKGYFINTVGQFGNEKSITEYVKKQGREKEYKKLHSPTNSCCSVRIPVACCGVVH